MLREWSARICGKIVYVRSFSLSVSRRIYSFSSSSSTLCVRAFYSRAHMQARAHMYVPRVARGTTEKAKNTFRINCRAGIPRRCAEQNAATLLVASKAWQDGQRRRTRW